MERDKKEVYEITEEVTQVVQNPSTQVASRPPPIPTVIPIQPYSYPYPVYSNHPSSNYQNQPASTGLSAAYSYNVQTCVDSVQAYSSGDVVSNTVMCPRCGFRNPIRSKRKQKCACGYVSSRFVVDT